MESAGNDDGGLARRHVLRTPFSTSLECSKITFALNSARKQTTAIFARIAPAPRRAASLSLSSRFLLPLPAVDEFALCRPHPFDDIRARGAIGSIRPFRDRAVSFARMTTTFSLRRYFRAVYLFSWPDGSSGICGSVLGDTDGSRYIYIYIYV